MTLRISVALATLNGERFLRPQLESLTHQTLRPYELVVCDDGSQDQTISIVSAFARSVPFPVRIFQNTASLGYRKNFMLAAQKCEGDLIAFCDQDDVWAPSKLEQVRQAFDKSDILLAFHNARLIKACGQQTGTIFRSDRPERIYEHLGVQPWMIIPGFSQTFHRSLLNFSQFHDQSVDVFCPAERMPHDQWFLFLATILGRIAYLPGLLADYRQHSGNTSGWLQARRFAYAAHNILYARYYASAALSAANNRLELLARLREVGEIDSETIDTALAYFRHIRTYAERRANLYTAKSFPKRAKSLASLIRHGAYTNPKTHLGMDSLLLDASVGLLGAPLQKY